MGRASALFLAGLGLVTSAQQAVAHPHVFIDTALSFVLTPDGRVEAVKVTWTYDDLYSLMIVEEGGFDPDGDGKLTVQELKQLQGFNSHWADDFPGNTYVLLNEAPVALSRPTDWTALYDDGQLTSTHLRHLEPPVRPEALALVLKNYDPEHYYAYRVVSAGFMGASKGCSSAIIAYDETAADAALSAASDAYLAADAADAPYPQIGAYFSDRVEVLCDDG